MLDAVAYKNGQKNNWRRTAWNRIAERVPSRHNAIVLYLPGSTDLDAPEALRRGFRPNNLIAVERDARVVKKLRASGRNCVNSGLAEVLEAWPSTSPVSVVVADLQSCLTPAVLSLLYSWERNPAFENSCLLINLQRGRENRGDMEFIRRLDSNFTRIDRMTDEEAEAYILKGETPEQSTKHRGELAFLWLVHSLALMTQATFGVSYQQAALVHSARFPCVYLPSYRSTPLSPVMDSLLFAPRISHFPHLPKDTPAVSVDAQVRRKISACLAVRTRKGEPPPISLREKVSWYPKSYGTSVRTFIEAVTSLGMPCERI